MYYQVARQQKVLTQFKTQRVQHAFFVKKIGNRKLKKSSWKNFL